jgi:hypothetical protein
MGKKILIGSMLVLTLLLLMPSIPAIQQKTVEYGFKQNIQEKLETITLDDLKDIDVLDGLKHPILYYIFISVLYIRDLKMVFNFIMLELCTETGFYDIDIIYPILFLIFAIRFLTNYYFYTCWAVFWGYLSIILEWNWGSTP